MTTSTNSTDDIIELTEIVEEGIPLDKKFEDFAMDKAVDAQSLDKELDDLLREAEPQSTPADETGDEIDLDILFDEPTPTETRSQPVPASATAQAPDQSMDISDLDDLFDSLGIGGNDDENTALDIILDGDTPEPKKHGGETFYPSDSIDLELELPGMQDDDKSSSVQDLTDDLLADIPETTLLESTDTSMFEHATASKEPSTIQPPAQGGSAETTAIQPEASAGDKPGQAIMKQEAEQATVDKPAPLQQAKDQTPSAPPATGTKPEPVQPLIAEESRVSNAELEIISARLDALESRPEPAPAPSPEELLALLPQSAKGLPLAEALQQEILDHVEAKVSELASSASVGELQESIRTLQSRVEALPDISAELAKTLSASAMQKIEDDLDNLRTLIQNRIDLGPEQILTLLPQSPKDLPLAETLRQEILDHVEARIEELAASARLDRLQESVNALQGRVESLPDISTELAKTLPASAMQKIEADLDDLRALIQNREEPGAEQILALLPQSPRDLPLAETLRQEILEHVEARVAELAASASVDGLQESVNALQSQVESIPDIRAELAKTLPASAMQKMEAELEDLRALVRSQEESLSALQKTLSEKDAAIATLSDGSSRLRAELGALAVKTQAAPDLDAIRSGLQEYVQQQMPAAAAKIIREEIQALLQELGD